MSKRNLWKVGFTMAGFVCKDGMVMSDYNLEENVVRELKERFPKWKNITVERI